MPAGSHAGDDAAAGFYFQGLFALVLLLDAQEHEAVSVETEDDVAQGAVAGDGEAVDRHRGRYMGDVSCPGIAPDAMRSEAPRPTDRSCLNPA